MLVSQLVTLIPSKTTFVILSKVEMVTEIRTNFKLFSNCSSEHDNIILQCQTELPLPVIVVGYLRLVEFGFLYFSYSAMTCAMPAL